MSKTGIIAFCGSKGSGKSTSATLFKELSGLQTEEIAIAGHLKEVSSHVFGVEYDKFINPSLKEVELETYIVLDAKSVQAVLTQFFVADYDFDKIVRPHIGRVLRTPRALLQYIGTEVLHAVDPLIHVKAAIQKKDKSKMTVITDLRFAAEFDYFNTSSPFMFMPVYVKNSAAEVAASADAHPSERQFEQFKTRCRLLDNEGSMSELGDKIRDLVKEVVNE